MAKKGTLTVILAIAGTVLVWLSILAPLFFSLVLFARAHGFRLDYLMPAELFPLVVAGGCALVIAAVRARSRRTLIGLAFGIAAGLLFVGQMLAVVTGLASGAAEPAGWRWGLVVACLAGYALAVVAMGVGGWLLLRDLFKRPRSRRRGARGARR
jgi:hypothetical protein